MHTRSVTHIGRTVWVGIATLMVLALAYAAWKNSSAFTSRIAYELAGPYTADSPIYWAVGRGILNGLTPYRDLFETKPPGIFLISSLSLWLTGTMQIGALIQALLLALIPLSVVFAAWKEARGHTEMTRWILVGGAFLFGTSLALYVGERSGEFQVESFGAAFAIAYAALLFMSRGTISRRGIALAASLIVLSTGMKEPFLLSCLAIALLLCESRRAFFRGFVLPAMIAGVAGVVLLLSIGMWDGYVHVYIPEMFGRYGHGGEALWMRGLKFNVLFRDLSGFSPMLAYGIAGIAIAQTVMGFWRTRIARGVWNLLTVLAALYLAALAVGTGNTYYNHHFVFAVGSFAALFLSFLRTAALHWKRGSFTRIVAMIVLLILLPTVNRRPLVDYKAQIAWYRDEQQSVQNVAAEIDTILDRCGVERYLFIGGNGGQPYGYTRHSPMGPLFFQFDHLLDDNHEKFRKEFVQSLHEARFVVQKNFDLNVLTTETVLYLEQEFTKEPWPCAPSIESNGPYSFYFRKPWKGGSLVREPSRSIP
ncbi:MAG: hypothetical protein V1876_01860 [Candidatus Peregrinibacteria bacterium]